MDMGSVQGGPFCPVHSPFNNHSITFSARKQHSALILPMSFLSIRLVPKTIGQLVKAGAEEQPAVSQGDAPFTAGWKRLFPPITVGVAERPPEEWCC